jgi:hypothetical protein
MTLSDNELLDFDESGLAMADAGDARRLLHEHGDVFRAQLVAARWIDGYLERREREVQSPTSDPRFEEAVRDTWRDIAANLRQGHFLPGGRLFEDEQKRKPDED